MKNLRFLLLATLLLASTFLTAQVANNLQTPTSINTDGAPPDGSAILDVQSTTQGMLVPRMTTAQRTAVATPATGLLVFDTDTGGFWFFNGSGWDDLSTPKKIADVDGDTKIQVEESADEDIIRFDVGGSEVARLFPTRLDLNQPEGNTFIGATAGANNNPGVSTGRLNTFLGASSGPNNTDGIQNSFFGQGSGFANDTGNDNVFIGYVSGAGNSTGIQNTYLGSFAGAGTNNGSGNIFIGYGAGELDNGSNRLYIESSPADSTGALIYGEFDNNLLRINGKLIATQGLNDGDMDTKIQVEESADEDIIRFDVAGSEKAIIDGTGLKWNAPYSFATLPSAGTYHGMFAHAHDLGRAYFSHSGNWVALAEAAKMFDTDGDTQIQLEESADEDVIRFDVAGAERMKFDGNTLHISPSSNSSNLFIGQDAGLNNTSFSNTFLGFNAGKANISGNRNTFIGHNAGLVHESGLGNVYIGNNAGAMEDGSEGNVFIGFFSGAKLTSGADNTFMGKQAGENVVMGGANTYIGKNAGRNNTNGSGNICIGVEAGLNETGNNKLYIDNSNTTTPLIWGDFSANRIGINRVATTNALEVGGEASKATMGNWAANSDARLKKDIQSLNAEEMLDKLLSLKGITYEWDDDKTGTVRPEGIMFGFTAQNIQEVFPSLVKEDNLGYLQTAYGTYDAMTVEAMRALNEQNLRQQKEIENLQNQLAEMEEVKAVSLELKQRMARLEAVLNNSKQANQFNED